MSNLDNARGAWPVRMISGGEMVGPTKYKLNASQGLAAGDGVILTSARINIALSSSGSLLGFLAAQENLDTAGTYANPGQEIVSSSTADDDILVWDNPLIVFRAQCSGSTVATLMATQCDIEGATSVMEVNENAINETVITIVGVVGYNADDNPDVALGALGQVDFIITRHQLFGDQTS